MNNACPECGAVYAVAEKDIGRRIACKKCQTALVVAEEGLKREDAVPPPKQDDDREKDKDRDDDDRPSRRRERDADDDDRPSRRKDRDADDDDRGGKKRGRDDDEEGGRGGKKRGRDADEEEGGDRKERGSRKARSGPGAGELFAKLKGVADVATWLYGIGLFLTIYGTFGAMLDQASIASRTAAKDMAAAEDEADISETRNKNDGKPSDDDNKAREKRAKEYQKEKDRLDTKEKYAKAGALSGQWWNTMFKLIGFLLLTFGSIGYLKPEQTQLKRILGGATVLLILLQVIGGGVGVGVHMGKN